MTIGTDVERAARLLRAGRLVAFPTETVYGLGADASSPAAVAAIFAAKGRPRAHPLIVHLAGADRADGADALAGWAAAPGPAARALAARFWPGPLTLIVRRGPQVIDAVTGGAATVGLRVPSHPVARALLAALGGTRGVAAPSANRFGRVSPTTAAHVAEDLGDRVDYILDGGACEVGVESTIVDVSDDERPALLRPGGVAREAIEELLGRALALGSASPAPGTLPSHYAPEAEVVIVDGDRLAPTVAALVARGVRPGVLAPPSVLARAGAVPADVVDGGLAEAPAAIARELYARLRELDARGVGVIVAVLPGEVGLGAAVADRLRRAAGPRAAAEDPRAEDATDGETP
jgi:L-threonylcarbamoyladenylate synthase